MTVYINSSNFDSATKIGDFIIVSNPLLMPDALASTYPQENVFSKFEGLNNKKYTFLLCSILNYESNISILDHNCLHDLPNWQDFISELLSDEYTLLLSKTTGINLVAKPRSLGLYKYSQGMFVEKHLDKDKKILTQLFYFNTDWSFFNGGELLIYRDSKAEPAMTIPPICMYSVIILRTPNSWHEVKAIKDAAFTRNSLQLEYWL